MAKPTRSDRELTSCCARAIDEAARLAYGRTLNLETDLSKSITLVSSAFYKGSETGRIRVSLF